ncbi:TRNA (guanine(26)-N(2))-dimethyltransferase [Aphelenchoides besseyi]|nr:TRNA (guanine(26)-N(2))-dimethyltransferase [Aphelenchoides besseyi]KAI6202311.1 TRNA (guanine(26)-N(2))-dimethyltransferase [Aphelenchoides besseyi]
MSNEITEGLAKITFDGKAESFYNPAQEFNRDLTVSVLRCLTKEKANDANEIVEPVSKKQKLEFVPGYRVLDALSASGLRALRFAKEVEGITHVVANDFSQDAVVNIKRNIEINGLSDKITAVYSDATQLMSDHRTLQKRFHAVDVDPYGSAAQFLNSAVQCVANRGVLMVTCTDMGTLCGNSPEAALGKYGSTPLRHKSCHESAIRIVLRTIQQHASMYDRYIEPLVCVSIDFYIRCFIRMHTGAQKAKDGALKLSHVLSCSGCHALSFQPLLHKTVNGNSIKYGLPRFASANIADTNGLCVHCGHPVQICGPLYTAPYFSRPFVKELLEDIKSTPTEKQLGTHKRLVGILSVMLEELDDIPLYYETDQLMNICKTTLPKTERFRSAILNAGYRVAGSHCNPKALKTDAPMEFLWDIVRTLALEQKKESTKLAVESPGRRILEIAPNKIEFKHHAQSVAQSRRTKLFRFQCNKGKAHGPKAKAKGSVNSAKSAGYADENMELRG